MQKYFLDNRTGLPLPFGTLGVHKGSGFKDADPCLFIFDCIFYNGENLMNRPLKDRRQFLVDNMTEVTNRVKLSEIKKITDKNELISMISDVFQQGLEGLMIKDSLSIYEPGKRHWLKIKKDYLNDGAMADSADLVVLGGWFGSGQKGGLISIFLMGCKDTTKNNWCTVSKVHTGHDDATLDRLQRELLPNMRKIKGDYNQVPGWVNINRNMVPDFIVLDPRKSPVWEITGAEFSKAELHTAGGISIRFPRVTKIRNDKTPENATTLQELKDLYAASKQSSDMNLGKNLEDKSADEKKKYLKKQKLDESNSKLPMNLSQKLEGTTDSEVTQAAKSKSSSHGFTCTIKIGDLFSSPESSSLAHCISKDCKLGKGIAKIFRQKFGRIQEIEECKADIGSIAVLNDGSRYIYNLVTKEKYYSKPTYENLRQSLEKMKEHAVNNNVQHICMPKIGCGLDGLQWPAVKTMMKNVLADTNLNVTVYTLEPEIVPTMDPASQSKQTSKYRELGKNQKTSNYYRYPVNDIRLIPLGFGYETKIPFPDIFVDFKVHICKNCPNYEKLLRNTIAFGGQLATKDEASHFIFHTEDSVQVREGCKYLQCQWLEDSIKLKQIQPEKLYTYKM